MGTPLADKIRPQSLDDMVGQGHILGKNGLLRRVASSKEIPNLIFYGPSGVGKTTAARIIAKSAGKKLYKLNGTTTSTAEIKEVINSIHTLDGMNGIVLYMDEIQYLNKKQQQTLLEHIEDGSITLIASTTENPYFYIYNAILSRSTVFEFKEVSSSEIDGALHRAFDSLNQDSNAVLEDGVLSYIAQSCGGDVRKAMNGLELLWLAANTTESDHVILTLEDAKLVAQRSAMHYDRDGDEHYEMLSALHKSVRGSDPDAAVYYLARMIEAGEILAPCRRLLAIACEDIGLAHPNAIVVVKACVDSAIQLGLPEARIPLAQAAIYLATQPKSNASYMAMARALEDVRSGHNYSSPRQLKNKHFDGAEVSVKGQFYKYPHDFENSYVQQQYLPDQLKDRVYYQYGDNKIEQTTKQYWDKIKKK